MRLLTRLLVSSQLLYAKAGSRDSGSRYRDHAYVVFLAEVLHCIGDLNCCYLAVQQRLNALKAKQLPIGIHGLDTVGDEHQSVLMLQRKAHHGGFRACEDTQPQGAFCGHVPASR